jgi:hypothetical protein
VVPCRSRQDPESEIIGGRGNSSAQRIAEVVGIALPSTQLDYGPRQRESRRVPTGWHPDLPANRTRVARGYAEIERAGGWLRGNTAQGSQRYKENSHSRRQNAGFLLSWS